MQFDAFQTLKIKETVRKLMVVGQYMDRKKSKFDALGFNTILATLMLCIGCRQGFKIKISSSLSSKYI